MSQLLPTPPRYTVDDWRRVRDSTFRNSEQERSTAERILAESSRLCNETARSTQRTQTAVKKRFQQRLDDLKFWREELRKKLSDVKKEISALDAIKKRLEQANEAYKHPLKVAQQCQSYRDNRLGIDLVADSPHRGLLKEVELSQDALTLLQKTIDQATEQLRLLRKSRFLLEKSLNDKEGAIDVDKYTASLTSTSPDCKLHSSDSLLASGHISRDAWQEISKKAVFGAEQECNASLQLRLLSSNILHQTSDDLYKQVKATDLAFGKRVQEIRETKRKLEDQHAKTIEQIREMQSNIDRLNLAISQKQPPLALAQTRLEKRQKRPSLEQTSDEVQRKLLVEIHELKTGISRLQNQLKMSQDTLKSLLRNQRLLEEDIAVKTRSLEMDEVKCMGLRATLNIQPY